MIVLLAFLPLQAWAGLGTSAADIGLAQAQQAGNTARVAVSVMTDQADQADQANHSAPASQESSYPADNAEPSPPGADFAEQLLPAPLPRMATAPGRGVVPQYAGTALPDPDLPSLSRPPRG